MQIHVGCCGMQMARAKYFQRFRVTEVQQTFYQPPQIKTLETWRAEAPPDFEFTLKAWQLITHTPSSKTYRRLSKPIAPGTESRYGRFQLTDEVLAAWQTTLACTRALNARFLLFQCPASFTPTPAHLANLRAFFTHIRRDRTGLILGFEPRGDWPVDLIRELTEELNLVYVVDPFVNEPLDQGPLRYLRLHGHPGTNYKYTYTDAELERLKSWCTAETTYVMFNNVPMVQDSDRFIRLLDGKYSGPSATLS
jgi:uncharacterized protein YecE (DUF72 family)